MKRVSAPSEGERLTYYPAGAAREDNRHWECVVKSLTPSGRFARIEYATSDGPKKRTVALSRLKHQQLLGIGHE